MDKKDLLIMAHLRADSRQRLTSLSKKTRIPVSTIFDRMNAYKEGVIKKHTALVDFSRLGYNARAKVVIKVDKADRSSVQELLMKNQNVNDLAKINNGFDFLFEVIFRHIKDVEDFIETLEEKFKIKAKEIYYIIDDLRREAFLADPQLVDLVDNLVKK